MWLAATGQEIRDHQESACEHGGPWGHGMASPPVHYHSAQGCPRCAGAPSRPYVLLCNHVAACRPGLVEPPSLYAVLAKQGGAA